MPESFHFQYPEWFWLLIPLLLLLWLLRRAHEQSSAWRKVCDARLLPFLTGRYDLPPRQQWRRFLFWSALWALLVIAIAGPRWDYRDVQLFRPGVAVTLPLAFLPAGESKGTIGTQPPDHKDAHPLARDHSHSMPRGQIGNP